MEILPPLPISKVKMLNPLVLAFVGDAVQTLYVRETLAKTSDYKAGQLHHLTAEKIKSHAQADQIDKLMPLLNDDEKEIFRRGRNAHQRTTAKNSTIADYKKASGLEAVFGYLYLSGQYDRLKTLLEA